MRIGELIERCRRNDPEAWAEMWQVVSSAAHYPIRRLLHRQGLDLELADDVLQEFYLYMHQGDLEHLRAFRGHAMPQFRVFIRTVAVHFALNALRKLKRAMRKEVHAARAASRPDRTGPTPSQIQAAMQELTSLMPAGDRAKLLQLLGDEVYDDSSEQSGDWQRSQRTQRRWREALFRKYGRRLK